MFGSAAVPFRSATTDATNNIKSDTFEHNCFRILPEGGQTGREVGVGGILEDVNSIIQLLRPLPSTGRRPFPTIVL